MARWQLRRHATSWAWAVRTVSGEVGFEVLKVLSGGVKYLYSWSAVSLEERRISGLSPFNFQPTSRAL